MSTPTTAETYHQSFVKNKLIQLELEFEHHHFLLSLSYDRHIAITHLYRDRNNNKKKTMVSKAQIGLLATVIGVGGFIFYIHTDQQDARLKMRQAVIKDIEREKWKEVNRNQQKN
ncbi:hypothetical protein DFA_03198 [Cavenderia fasciculata]|uniref:Transmembrane protein n=1 Tax=Cavenderia fasciculata TaxID=261658 RepID=F4PGW9_CACFS|nr:uncharacterized protein DFA_03198 [Cavenderia fasciculata]EGG24953.1 hypothetical protein DFA_03198 [Cavenderia fasciculata]|eukprot:XP_004362804.1 hypothetical protein DFA_03198 [Cavenderia fasciculata]